MSKPMQSKESPSRGPGMRARGASPGEDIVAAFVRRYTPLLRRLGEAATRDALLRALAASDDVGGLAGLIAEVGPVEGPAPDPLAAAHARAASARSAALAQAGGALRVGEVAAMMGVTRQAVDARRTRRTLLAVPLPNGEHVYPAAQFRDGRPAPGLERFLKAFAVWDAWTALGALVARSARLDGRSALDALWERDAEAALTVARAYGEHLA